MKDRHLAQALGAVRVPPGESACDWAAAAAREQVARQGPQPATASPGAGRSRVRVQRALVVAIVVGAALSPPGRAAVDGLGALAGIGEVGGESSQTPPDLGQGSESPTVIHVGSGPGDRRYEWIAYHARTPARLGGGKMFCVGLDWPGVRIPERTSFGCEGRRSDAELRAPSNGFNGIGFEVLPAEVNPRRDIVLYGLMREDVVGVRAWLTDERATRHEIPVDFKRIDGELLERVAGYYPFGVFVAVLDARIAPPVSELRDVMLERPEMPCRQPAGALEFVVLRSGGRGETVRTGRAGC